MNLILDGLPKTVDILGQSVPIDTSFRTGILFEQALQDVTMSDAEKLDTALALYFPGIRFPYSARSAAVDALIHFYRCGSDEPVDESGGAGADGAGAFSYEYDAKYIYAAFVQAYKIDLAVDNLHWWQFRALFESLPDDTMFVKIIGYRTAEIPQNASKETRQRMEKLKRLYALPVDADRKKLTTDLEAILIAGGNPSALLEAEGADRSWHSMEP